MSWKELNFYMQNLGSEQYSQDTFKAVYDQDPKVKDIVSSFDPEGVSTKMGMKLIKNFINN